MDVSDSYAAIGAYAYKDLRGSVHFATLPYLFAPTASPTNAPVAVNNLNSNNVLGNLSAGMVAAIFLSGFLALGVCALVIYFCCCRATPVALLDKKKKKEEEDSPYTVHSYAGYHEMTDNKAPRPPLPQPFMTPYPPPMPGMMMMPPNYDPVMEKKMMMKDGKGGDKIIDSAEPGFIRQMFPYKVHSYQGYREDDPAHQKTQLYQQPLAVIQEEEGDSDNYRKGESAEGSPYYPDPNQQYQPSYNMDQGENEQTELQHMPNDLSYQQAVNHVPSAVEGVDVSAIRPDLRKYYADKAAEYTNGNFFANKFGKVNVDAEEGKDENPQSNVGEKAAEEGKEEVNVESAQVKYARYLAAAKNPAIQSKIQAVNQQNQRIAKRRSLQSASMELDVALTEPMKLLSVQEAREKNLRSESIDPESRNDLAQQDEVDRLRFVEAARQAQSTMIGSVPSTDEETVHLQESKRLEEEEKLRNEEAVRARFARYKSKAEAESRL
jgi:hypothetical protein